MGLGLSTPRHAVAVAGSCLCHLMSTSVSRQERSASYNAALKQRLYPIP